jgi:hypothetical protein
MAQSSLMAPMTEKALAKVALSTGIPSGVFA